MIYQGIKVQFWAPKEKSRHSQSSEVKINIFIEKNCQGFLSKFSH